MRRRDRPHCRPGQAGLTLLELLVALSIFAVLGVMSYRGLAALAAGEARVSVESRRWAALARFFQRLEEDLAQAVEPAAGVAGAARPAGLVYAPTAASGLQFLRVDAQQGLLRVEYRLTGGRVELLEAAPHAAAEAAPGAAIREVLLPDVQALRWEFLPATGEWLDRWPPPGAAPGGPPLPRAVRLRLTPTAGAEIVRLFALR